MVKINQEEYEVLKELDDKWKWIAREGEYGGLIFCFREKPHKDIRGGEWGPDATQYKYLGGYELLFQFIQWEDDEPYNIQELIEGYEDSKEYKDSLVIEYFMDKANESEEAEVKKDIEWLKEKVQKRIDKLPRTYSGLYIDGSRDAYHLALKDINQLDEPEVLSQELPVIPQFVAEWIEDYKEREDIYTALSNAFEGMESVEIYNWVSGYTGVANQETFARAWLDGFTVEEEQKYVVELPNPNNQLGRHKNVFLNKKDGEVFIDSASLFVNDITKYGQFALTEEEIKKDFEWAWAFAKRVEELEE